MFTPSSSDAFIGQVLNVKRSDRWQIYHRLQELMIRCWCLEDGSLRAEANDAITAILIRSTVQQFTCSRQELVTWLERCWQVPSGNGG